MAEQYRILIVEDSAEWVKMHRQLLDEIFAEGPAAVDVCFTGIMQPIDVKPYCH